MAEQQRGPFFSDITEAIHMTFHGRIMAIQFVGTFLGLAIFYTALSIAFVMKNLMVGACIISLGLLLGYPLIALTLLATATLQTSVHTESLRQIAAAIYPKAVRTLIFSLLCAGLTVFLAIPQSVLLKIGTAGDAGQVLLALFLIPLLGLTLLQMVILFFGLFVIPQLIATEEGDSVELFQIFKEILVYGGRKLAARHTVGIIVSILFAFPFWLAIDFSAGILGAMTTSLVGKIPSAASSPAPSEVTSPSLVLPLLSQRVSAFSPVWLQFNNVALYFTGLAVTFAFAIPLTIGILMQSSSSLLALRALAEEVGRMDYPVSTG